MCVWMEGKVSYCDAGNAGGGVEGSMSCLRALVMEEVTAGGGGSCRGGGDGGLGGWLLGPQEGAGRQGRNRREMPGGAV